MIIAFETQDSVPLNNFIDSFREPSSPFARLRHSYEYTSKSFKRLGNVFIFEFESILNILSKRALIVSVCIFLMSYVFHWRVFSILTLIIIFMAMVSISKSVKQLIFLLKLKRAGHKFKVVFVSNDFLLNKFLSEVPDGSA